MQKPHSHDEEVNSDARQLFGDLLVATTEIAERRGEADRWLRLASAAMRALHAENGATLLGTADVDELVANVVASITDAMIAEHLAAAVPFAGSVLWERACAYRSGFEDLRPLLGE